jgi:ubiquinone/menaquinone biosynthesis C-methylase UbiE
MNDPTQRFSSRVENYVKYRPGYPPQVLSTLVDECALQPDSVVADVGSGTGILSELSCAMGTRFMELSLTSRCAAPVNAYCTSTCNFRSVDGTAEASTLPDHSVDFVTAGQAFHWFDRDACRVEFARILKFGGWVVLIWNERRTSGTPFLQAYEALLEKYATDYAEVNHTQIDDEVITQFYAPGHYQTRSFNNEQTFDFEALQGRLLSSSYAPELGHPNFQQMLTELRRVFEENQQDGVVRFEYETNVHFGRFDPDTC